MTSLRVPLVSCFVLVGLSLFAPALSASDGGVVMDEVDLGSSVTYADGEPHGGNVVTIGAAVGTNAILTVDGANTVFTFVSAQNHIIGGSGEGRFMLTNGASATAWGKTMIGAAAGGVGEVMVFGGSQFSMKASATLGAAAGASGTFSVSGGSLAEVQGFFNVGYEGHGLLNVHSGAQLTVNALGTDLGWLSIGAKGGDAETPGGVVNLNGASSSIHVAAGVNLGAEGGFGALTISDDAFFETQRVTVNRGVVTLDRGFMKVATDNPDWGIYVSGNGTLNVRNGGDFVAPRLSLDGGAANFSSFIAVDEFGESELFTATWNLHNEATLTHNGLTLGQNAGDHVTVHVGSGASIVGNDWVNVGWNGKATLHMNGGATWSGPSLAVGQNTGAEGQINLGWTGAPGGSASFSTASIGAAGKGAIYVSAGVQLTVNGWVGLGTQSGGEGRVDISEGGMVVAANGLSVGNSEGGEGLITVRGGNSSMNAARHVLIGWEGKGTLSVENGADFNVLKAEDSIDGDEGGGNLTIGGRAGTDHSNIGGRVTVSGVDPGDESNPSILNVIEGGISLGYEGSGVLDLFNRGQVFANFVNVHNGYLHIENQSHVTIRDGGSLNLDTEGALHIVGASIHAPNINGQGHISGYGTIDGYVNTQGSMDVGRPNTSGILRIQGNLNQGPGSYTRFDLFSGGFDRLEVNGHANLGGTIDVHLAEDFAPVNGQSYQILYWAGSRSGTPNVQIGGLPGWSFYPVWQANTLAIVAVPDAAVGGEFNDDFADDSHWSNWSSDPANLTFADHKLKLISTGGGANSTWAAAVPRDPGLSGPNVLVAPAHQSWTASVRAHLKSGLGTRLGDELRVMIHVTQVRGGALIDGNVASVGLVRINHAPWPESYGVAAQAVVNGRFDSNTLTTQPDTAAVEEVILKLDYTADQKLVASYAIPPEDGEPDFVVIATYDLVDLWGVGTASHFRVLLVGQTGAFPASLDPAYPVFGDGDAFFQDFQATGLVPESAAVATTQAAASNLPHITSQPNTTPALGILERGSVTLNVGASGSGLTYQWRRDGVPIGGATSSSHAADSSGAYDVVVRTASGAVRSGVVLVHEVEEAGVFPSFASRNPLPGAPTLTDVIFADGRFVAVGVDGVVRTSLNGMNWLTFSTPTSHTVLNGVGYSSALDLFVAAGSGGDLFTWTGTPSDNWIERSVGTSDYFTTVAVSPERIVVRGGGNFVVTSTDGVTWTRQTLSIGGNVESMAFGGGVFVAVGFNGRIERSGDGLSWEIVTAPGAATGNAINDVEYIDGQFVAVGGNGLLMTSSDGAEWTVRPTGFGNFFRTVEKIGATWVIFDNGPRYVTSTNLADFTMESLPGSLTAFTGSATGAGRTVAVGGGGEIVSSNNGTAWLNHATSGGLSAFFDGVYAEGKYVFVGSEGAIMASTDSVTFTWKANPPNGNWIEAVIHDGSCFVASAWDSILISDDGETWTANDPNVGFDSGWKGLAYNGTTYVAVGDNGKIMRSGDAEVWTESSSGVGSALCAVTWFDGEAEDFFVTVGGNGTLLTSPTGETWTKQESPVPSAYLQSVRAIDGKLFVVGEGWTLLVSTDGVEWTRIALDGAGGYNTRDIARLPNGLYVIAGVQGGFYTSPDGEHWTWQGQTITRGQIERIVVGPDAIIAAGRGGTLLQAAFPTGNTPPTIVSGPEPQVVATGENLTLTVQVSGSGPFSYQWFRDDEPIAGSAAMRQTLMLANADENNAGNYRVTVYGVGGNVTSEVATIDIAPAAVPSNDNFASAEVLDPSGGELTANTGGATNEAGESIGGVSSLWYKFTPTVSGPTQITVTQLGNAAVRAVYIGDSISTLWPVAALYGGSGEPLVFNVVGGLPYYVSVGSWTGSEGPLNLSWGPTSLVSPKIIIHPAPQSITPNAAATFSVTASGTGPLTYQWCRIPAGENFIDPVPLEENSTYSGVAAPTLTVAATSEMTGDQFFCIVSSEVHPVAVSHWATLTVFDANHVSHTGSITVGDGANIDFVNERAAEVLNGGEVQVSLGDSPTLSTYDYLQRGIADLGVIAGSIEDAVPPSNYTRSVSLSLGHTYVALIGVGTEAPAQYAVLRVAELSGASVKIDYQVFFDSTHALRILQQPEEGTILAEGATGRIAVSAVGQGIRYQWQKKNGSNFEDMAGATARVLRFNGVLSESGSYRVKVTDVGENSLTGAEAHVTINPFAAPDFTRQPAALTGIVSGGSRTLSFEFDAVPAPTVYVVKNGSAFPVWASPVNASYSPGESEAHFTVNLNFSNFDQAQAGIYQIALSSPVGGVLSAPVNVAVAGTPAITGISPSTDIKAGSAVTITGTNFTEITEVKFGELDAVSFQVDSPTQITAVVPVGVLDGVVSVAGLGGTSAGSGVASYTTAALPVITEQPHNITATSGDHDVTFTVAATGSGELSYQWRRFGFPIVGATSTSYTIEEAKIGDTDYYDVVVTDDNGATTSAMARLDVAPTAYPGQLTLDSAWSVPVEKESVIINEILPLASGGFLAAGDFTKVDGHTTRGVARFTATGEIDTTFTAAVDGVVASAALQPDGKLLVTGALSADTLSGRRTGLIRLNQDGSVDESFHAASVTSGYLVAVDTDDRVYASVNLLGVSTTQFVRFHGSDGSIDPTFASGYGDRYIRAVAIQPSGNVVVAAATTVGTRTADEIGRLLAASGAVDESFVPVTVALAWKLVLDSAGRIYPVGNQSDGSSNQTGRLNSNGGWDESYARLAVNGTTYALALEQDGAAMIAGSLWEVDGQTSTHVARLNADGSLAAVIPAGDAAGDVRAIARVSGNGGGWIAANSLFARETPRRTFRIAANGEVDETFAPEWRGNGVIKNVVVQSDGRLVIGGDFVTVAGISSPYVARLNTDGSVDATFGAGGQPNRAVQALKQQADGSLLLMGVFTHIGGVERQAWARLSADGALDTSFAGTDGVSAVYNDKYMLLPLPGGSMLVGSWWFTELGGAGVIKLRADGSFDAAFTETLNSSIGHPITGLVQPDGRIVLGGFISFSSGTSLLRLEASGAIDTDYGFSTISFASGLTATSDVWVATTAGLLRFLPSGDLDQSFVTPAGLSLGFLSVPTLIPQAEGEMIVPGEIGFEGVAPAPRMLRFNADGSIDPTFGVSGLTAPITAVVQRDDGQFYLATNGVLTRTNTLAAPVITDDPVAATAPLNTDVILSVTATGEHLAYQWRKDGDPIEGATQFVLLLDEIQPADAGSYDVVVSNAAGFDTSAAVEVVVLTPPVVGSQTSWQKVFEGNTARFNTSSANALSYQWQRSTNGGEDWNDVTDDETFDGSTTASLSVSGVNVAMNGWLFRARLTNDIGETITPAAPLTVLPSSAETVLAQGFGGGSYALPVYAPKAIAGDVKDVAAGANHTLFITTDGTLWATGENRNGQLGDGTTQSRSAPIQVATNVVKVSASQSHTMFIKTDGTLWGTGANWSGKLGDGTEADRPTPAPMPGAIGVIAVAAGDGHTLFIKSDQTLWGVGGNDNGQLGVGDTDNRTSPVQIDTGVTSVGVSTYGDTSYYLKSDGSLYAMGQNDAGQLGNGTTVRSTTPIVVATGVTSFAVGQSHAVFFKDGELWAVGSNSSGQFGDGTRVDSLSPVLVEEEGVFHIASMAAGGNHTVFVDEDGALWGMGGALSGALGGPFESIFQTTPVPIALDVVKVSAGAGHTLFIKEDGTLWATGSNASGQLGDRQPPASGPAILTGVKSAAASAVSSNLFVKTDGTLWAQVGARMLQVVSDEEPVTDVVDGFANLFASMQLYLKNDGTLWLLSNGGPVQIGENVITAGAGVNYYVYLKSDGTLWGRGYQAGQIEFGDGTSDVKIADRVESLSASGWHFLFVKEDHTLWGMGTAWGGLVPAENWGVQSIDEPIQLESGVRLAVADQNQNLVLRTDGTLWTRGQGWHHGAGPSAQVDADVIGMASGGNNGTLYFKADGVLRFRPGIKAPLGDTTIVAENVTSVHGGSGGWAIYLQRAGYGTAPSISTQPQSAVVALGTSHTLQVAATGTAPLGYQWFKDDQPVTWAQAPQYTIPFATASDNGVYRVVVSNAAGETESAEATIVVPAPPFITEAPEAATVIAGGSATFEVVASGVPAPTYQWRRNGINIPGATSPTLTLSNVALNGGGSITVRVANSAGTVVSVPVTLTVNPVAPVITSPLTATASVGRSFTYQIGTNTIATFEANGVPAGLTFSAATGVISGQPSGSGVSTITLKATNVSGSDTKSLVLTVNPPPPVITSAVGATSRVNQVFNYTIEASNSPTGYSAQGLPPGLALSGNTITGTPTAAGAFAVTITATNASGSVTQTLQLDIHPALNAPVYTGASNPSGTQTMEFNFAPVFVNGVTSYQIIAGDLPGGLTLDEITGVISGTPTEVGSFPITLGATGAGGSTAVALTIVINPAPTAPVVTSASTTSATVGVEFEFQLTTDVPATGFVMSGLPPGISLEPIVNVLSGTPTAAGTYRANIAGRNANGTGPTSVLIITVNHSPNAPVIASAPTVEGRVGVGFANTTYRFVTNQAADLVEITAGALPAGLNLASDHDGWLIAGTPTASGNVRVAFAGTNAAGGRGPSLEVLFTIRPPLTVPVITSNGTAAGQVGQPFSYAITATNSPTGFSATGLPAWLTRDGALLSGIPTSATTAPLAIVVGAANGDGAGAPKTVSISIAPAPQTPVVTSASTASGRVGVAFTPYQITATGSPSSFSATDLPPGLSVDPSTGQISGTPLQAGTFAAKLRAGNSAGLGVESRLVIAIAPALQAPTIISAASATGQVGVTFNYLIDVPETQLAGITNYAVTGTLPTGLALNTTTGLISGKPAEPGMFLVQLGATSAGGTSLPQDLLIRINPALGVPVITSPIYAIGTVGVDFSYAITATNMPGGTPFLPAVTLDAVHLPEGLAINPSTGQIRGRPAAAGVFTVTLVGTNAAGVGPYRDLMIFVQPAPTAPVITSAASAAAQVGVPFSYQIAATNSPVSYDVLEAPAWMTVNALSGSIGGTPTSPGTATVQLVATNDAGASNPLTLVLHIAPAANTPVITSTRSATGQLNAAFTYAITATNTPTSFVASGLPAGLSINGATISGTPQASGTFNVTLHGVNANGTGQAMILVLTINPSLQLVVQ